MLKAGSNLEVVPRQRRAHQLLFYYLVLCAIGSDEQSLLSLRTCAEFNPSQDGKFEPPPPCASVLAMAPCKLAQAHVAPFFILIIQSDEKLSGWVTANKFAAAQSPHFQLWRVLNPCKTALITSEGRKRVDLLN